MQWCGLALVMSGLIGSPAVSAGTVLGTLVSRSPADTNGVYRRAVNDTMTVTLTYRNVGTDDWSAIASQSGYVVVASFDSTTTTVTPSPLAMNWLSATTIATVNPSLVVAHLPEPNRETSAWLHWTAPGDDGLSGRASQYEGRYALSLLTSSSWALGMPITGLPTPAPSGAYDSVRVAQLQPNTTYWFGLRTADERPNWSPLSNVVQFTTLTSYATVRLPVRMPSTPGRYILTVALRHSSTGTLASSGLRLTFDVQGPPPSPPPSQSTDFRPFTGRFNRDGLTDAATWDRLNDRFAVGLTDTTTQRFITAGSFLHWPETHGADTLFTGQFVGDSLHDVCVHLPNGEWLMATNVNGVLTPVSVPWLRSFGQNRQAVSGDFNGDGLMDVGYFHPDSLSFTVALNRGNRLEPVAGTTANGSWITWTTAIPKPFLPLTGVFNNDQRTDVGFRHPTRGQVFIATSNGSNRFTIANGSSQDGSWVNGWAANVFGQRWLTQAAPVSPDQMSDLVASSASGIIAVARSTGTTGQTGADWLYSWPADSAVRFTLLADVTGDRRADLLSMSVTTGEWLVARSTGTAFSRLGTDWGGGFGKNLVGSGTLAVDRGVSTSSRHLKIVSANPFRQSLTIEVRPTDEPIALAIYDLRGALVEQVHDGSAPIGSRFAWTPSHHPPGIYFVHLQVGHHRESRQVVYLK